MSNAHTNLLDEVSDHYGMAWSDASRLTLYADFLAETTLLGPWGRFLMARAEEEQSMGANNTNQGSEGDEDGNEPNERDKVEGILTLAGPSDAEAEVLQDFLATESHEALCPQRVGGECMCIKSRVVEFLQEHGYDTP